MPTPVAETKGANLQSKTSAPSNPEHDLDVFLLGDLGSDDDGPGICFIFNSQCNLCILIHISCLYSCCFLSGVLFLQKLRRNSVKILDADICGHFLHFR